jgi:hypothetical protein
MQATPFRNALDKLDRKKLLMKCLACLRSVGKKVERLRSEQLDCILIAPLLER